MPNNVQLGIEVTPEVTSTVQEAAIPDSETAPTNVELGAEPAGEVTAGEQEVESRKEKLVPLAALHEERERRKELAAKLEEADRRNVAERAKLDERLNIIMQSLQQQTTPQAPTEPQFIQQFMEANPGVSKEQAEAAWLEDEPTNYLKWKQEELAKQVTAIQQQAGEQAETTKKQTEYQQFVSAYQAKSAEFAQKTPEFKEAYNFIVSNRDRELQILGFTDPVQRNNIISNEELGIAQQAFREGVNPAQRIYEMAKFRGFKPQTVSPPGESAANLDKEKQAAAATRSLGGVPGSTQTKVTAEVLLSMSEEEFAAATKDGKWAEVFR